MLANISGIELSIAVVLSILGIVWIVLAVLQFRGKGPVFSMTYMMVERDDREKMATKEVYRNSAWLKLGLALVFLSFAGYFYTNLSGFALFGTIFLACICTVLMMNMITRK